MEIEKGKHQIVVKLTAEEVFRIQDRGRVGDRGGLIPDSKIEITHLANIENDPTMEARFADDRFEQASTVPLKAHLFPNEDLTIYLPDVTLRDVWVSERTLKPDEIETVNGAPKEMMQLVPRDGVRILFGGSMQAVDIPSTFINATS